MVEGGIQPDLLLSNQYGHHLHVWDLRRRRHKQAIDLGPEHQMVLELRPAHDPSRLPWLRRRRRLDGRPQRLGLAVAPPGRRQRRRREGHHHPARAGRARPAPRRAEALSAVPPLVTDIALSIDDQELFVSAGARASSSATTSRTPPVRRRPAACASAASSGARRTPRRAPLNGGPQMVEISRDGRRLYLTNSLYASWDAQFYPEGIDGWMVKLDNNGSLELDPRFFVEFDGERPHQIRLEGGDASSDSYCFPS
jgi:selenium-binding protein 1